MKPLLNQNKKLNDAGKDLKRQAGGAIGPIFKAFANTGHSPREISRIIVDVVLDLESEHHHDSKS